MNAQTIAVANQKGGVAKTTTTANLAYALHKAGQRVLLIDMDPQSSLSIAFGIDALRINRLEEDGKTVYFALTKGTDLKSLVIPGNDGRPDLVPSSIRLASAESELVSPFGATHILRDKILPLREAYDFILIDCPPTLGLLVVNALSAADSVVIPVKTDLLSVMGVPLLLETIANVRQRANPGLQILGVLPTLFHPRNTHDTEVLSELKAVLRRDGIGLFEPIQHSTSFDKAASAGMPTIAKWPKSPGAENYQSLATRLLEARSSN